MTEPEPVPPLVTVSDLTGGALPVRVYVNSLGGSGAKLAAVPSSFAATTENLNADPALPAMPRSDALTLTVAKLEPVEPENVVRSVLTMNLNPWLSGFSQWAIAGVPGAAPVPNTPSAHSFPVYSEFRTSDEHPVPA